MTVLLPFLIAFLVGFLLSKILIKLDKPIELFLLRIFIGIGLGIGVISILNFISLMLLSNKTSYFNSKIFNKILAVLTAILIIYILISEIHKIFRIKKSVHVSMQFILLSLVLAIAMVFIFDRFWMISAGNSHGGWDAWAIWNLHASFIYFGGDEWRNLFTDILRWSHVDYPLMTPSMIVFGWKILGNNSRFIPMILGAIYTFGTIGVTYAALLYLRNYKIASIAVLILGFTLTFIREGASQYADVPLAFYISCVFSLLLIVTSRKNLDYKLFVLIGILLGFSTWTKNEGIVFVVIFFLVLGIKEVLNKSIEWKMWGALLIGFIPIEFVLLIFKSITIGNGMVNSLSLQGIMSKLLDYERYKIVIKNTITYLLQFGQKDFSVFIIITILLIITGIKFSLNNNGIVIGFGVLITTFILYLFIYVLTPNDIDWHMRTSFLRLVVQLYPSLIICLFTIMRDPFALQETIP